MKRFELMLIGAVLVCLGLGYFLLMSVVNQPDYLREIVWDEQFDINNSDVNFHTPFESYVVDLGLWRDVPDRLRAMHVSMVRQTIVREVIRRDDQEEYLLTLHTSGLKPDFVCLTHAFGFTKDYTSAKPPGAERLNRYTARIDIRNEPVGQPFKIEFIIYSWNAFQGEDNQMFGVFAKPRAQKLVMSFVLPKDVAPQSLRLERFDQTTQNSTELSRSDVDVVEYNSKLIEFTIDSPFEGDGYFVRW